MKKIISLIACILGIMGEYIAGAIEDGSDMCDDYITRRDERRNIQE